jgi:peptidoglycan/xylan/chitin deacetylase (PgdA/CDA1 family)
MVVLGLVLGVVVAVIFAAQGCGSHDTGKRRFHGSAPPPPAAPAAPPPAAPPHHTAVIARQADPAGPFFGYAHGHMTRHDAPATRMVALTFDDGPGPQTTQILAELQQLRAPATFFVVGSMAAARPDVVVAEKRAGMEIANHTWSHPRMTSLTDSQRRTEIEQTTAILRKLTGRRPRFFRPPNWRVNGPVARIVRHERLIGVLRTADTRDWTLPGTRAIVRAALRVKPGGIVAMHDAGGYTRSQTVQAVPAIIRGLRRRHLRLVTVGRLYAGRGA